MTSPFEQIASLGKANGQLAVTLASIARDNAETYAKISGQAATAIFDQFKELKPGVVPSFSSEPITGLFGEIEKSREASVAKTKAAFEEWQGCCKDVLSEAAGGQQDLTQSVQSWFQPLFKPIATEQEKAAKVPAPAPRTPAKPAETA